jgi:hypothetical protein
MPRKLLVLAAMIALTPLLAVSQDDASTDNANAARANEPAPATASSPIAAVFFAIDVAGKYCCSTTDPWPWTGVAAEGSTKAATWRTLGSGVSWMDISPCDPTATSCSMGNSWTCNSAGRCYDWSLLDYYVGLKPSGQAMMFTAWGTPAWDQLVVNNCNSSANQGSCPPADLSSGDTAWKNFITDLINHEGVGKIKYLEIWNEPNQPTSWVQGSQYITDLAQMVADGSAAAKAADSGIKVISPPVTADSGSQYTYPNCSGIDVYLSELLNAGVATDKNVNIIGFHGYVSLNNTTYYALDAECVGQLIASVQSAVHAAGIASGKLIYDTEDSWGGGQNESRIDPIETSNEEFAFTGIDYLIQASNTVCSSTPCYPLTGFSWFGWDFETSTGVFWGSSAANGSSPCPTGTAAACLTNAGKVYVNVYQWLVGAIPTAPCSRDNTTSIWTCNFTRKSPSGYKAQAVWSDSPSCSSGCTYNSGNGFPSYAVYYRTLTSVPSSGDIKLSPAGSATIGFTPILLENVKLN